ncbi:MAG: ATP-dependent endonuclease [Gemmatimonadetes bacterium]|nr:ATP-dependent endonuclease [Gemmatimonadota bacterium]
MNIREIRVKNFRSLRDATLSCDRLTAIVGRNGTGKSSFLRALELFYDQSAMATRDDFYNGDIDQDISITVTFSDLTPDALRLFSSYVDKGTLSVTGVFSGEQGRNNGKYHGTRLKNKDFVPVRNAGGLLAVRTAYRKLQADQPEKYGSLPPVTRGDDALAALEDWENRHPQACSPALDEGQFFGFKGGGKGYLGKHTTFIRIPAVRDALSDATEARGSSMTQLMDKVVRGTLASRADVMSFEAEVKARYVTLFDSSNLEELQGLESQLAATLGQYAPNAGITLDWSQLDGPQIPMPQAQVKLSEDGYESAVGRAGHGLQRAFILTALQHLVATQVADPSEKASGESGEATSDAGSDDLPSLVLAIEEPELYQHPSRQRHMASVLYDLAMGSIPGVAKRTQVLYTTHAPLFVGLDRVDQIRLLRKRSHQPTQPPITMVHATSLTQVAEELWSISDRKGVKYTAETLRPRMQVLMTPWMNEGFFADVVVLVEGEGDRSALLAVGELEGHDMESMGICVVPCGGKRSLDRPTVVFRELGIPTYVIWDNDNGSRDARPGDNRHLLRLVEAEEQDWPAGVWDTHAALDGNLERVLKREISERVFEDLLSDRRDEFGMKKKQALKNPFILRSIIRDAHAKGLRSRTLSDIVNAIVQIHPMHGDRGREFGP